jgi:hypothetical protein
MFQPRGGGITAGLARNLKSAIYNLKSTVRNLDPSPALLLPTLFLMSPDFAEVVELADTPSMALGLLILSKFLITALLTFTPID